MWTYALLALAAAVEAVPQGVTQAIAPSAPAPAGCSPNYSGKFQVTVVNVTSNAAAKLSKRDALELTLAGGILKDAQQRTGYVASNYQFQFDGPPQAGSIYTAGFSVCGNGSLALGGSAIWYQCYSGGFYNLYDRHWAAQCSPIYINVIGGKVSAGVASQIADGQVQATPNPVAQIGDGQIQGQPQAPGPSQVAIGQISDGQIQAPKGGSGSAVTQIGDGQVQAPKASATPVAQISDGQIQASKGASVAPVASAAASKGASVSAVASAASRTVSAAVSQPTNGQIIGGSSPATATTARTSSPASQSANAALNNKGEVGAIVAGIAAAVAFL